MEYCTVLPLMSIRFSASILNSFFYVELRYVLVRLAMIMRLFLVKHGVLALRENNGGSIFCKKMSSNIVI